MLPYQKVKKHKFGNKNYQVIWRKPRGAEGLCNPPSNPARKRAIKVNPHLDAAEFMEIILHEGTHAEQWYLDEDSVIGISSRLADLLWKCGYRLTDGKGNIIDYPKPIRKH